MTCLKLLLSRVFLQVSHLFFQAVVNLSEKLNYERDMPADTRIYGPSMAVEHEREFYNLPYILSASSIEDILIVGSGAGNDVAAANRFNIKNIDAVEIDPVIATLGKKLHPENPYSSINVDLHINDARSFIKNNYSSIV